MKKLIASTLLVILVNHLPAQSLSPERVKKIKDATVRISIVDSASGSVLSNGTGFFIDSTGTLATCGHVAINSIVNGKQVYKILAQTKNGDTVKYSFPPLQYQDRVVTYMSFANDVVLLLPESGISFKSKYLKIGGLSDAEEGDQVYTCGYPFGIMEQFISMGILSTKYTDSTFAIFYGKEIYKNNREAAYFDLTISKGNSGGAIVRIGKTPEEDIVIGVVDMIKSAAIFITDSLLQTFQDPPGVTTGMKLGNLEVKPILKRLAEAMTYTSNGISIGVSSDYINRLYPLIRRRYSKR